MALPEAGAGLPLAGLRVLDFGTTVAGPTAARHLADFGAQVIKIESQVHPDTLRVSTPYREGQAGLNRSGYFGAYNAGKLSMALNLRMAESRDVVRRLVERADVVVETFVPGVMERWGLDYERLSEWNPGLIMASHCLQGQTGPHAKHRGYGQIASAMSGWYDLTGLEGDEPLGPYSAYTDFVAWPFLLTAILVALEVRDITGRGQHIDHAQLETSIHFLAAPLLDLQVNDRLLTRRGNREDYAAPNDVYPCAGDDRWIAITVASDSEWRALRGALGLGDDPRFATHAGREANRRELDDMLARRTANEEPFALEQRLQHSGVAAGVVARAEDLFDDPQLTHRQFFRRLDHPDLGDHAVLRQSFRIEGVDAGPWRAAPLLGEHTYDICRDILGMTGDEIGDLAEKGVFQ